MIYKLLDVDMVLYRQDLKIIIPVVVGLIGLMIFWFTQTSQKFKQKFLNKYGEDQGSVKFIMFTRYLGGFSIGVIPLIIYILTFPDTRLSQLGLGLNMETLPATILWTVGLSIVVIPLVRYNAKKPFNLKYYPQIRAKEWNRKIINGNLATWVIYLLGYEFFFRGLLLFPLVSEIGLWPAIAVNVCLYTATHIPHGREIAIGTIPLSIVLCLLSVKTETIWIAFFVHITISWTNSLTALKHNPEMKIVKK